MLGHRLRRALCVLAATVAGAGLAAGQTVERATLGEAAPRTAEVSTAELRQILAERSATVFDTRPVREYALSHIPGALNVAAKPGVPIAVYVSDAAEIGRAVKGDKSAPVVLYCNGPFCGKSKRLADDLLAAGHTNVRRYQLGIPVWRALGGPCQIEPDGLRYVVGEDATAVLIDAREADAFARGSLPRARNTPRSLVLEGKDVGEVRRAKDDGRLPVEDHNTRIVVVAATADAAAFVAGALAREAFHNVAYFAGTFDEARAALSVPSDEAALRALHEKVMRAHLAGDVEMVLADEPEDYVVAGRGEITRPSREERRQRMGPYLRSTKFEVYRDLAEPVVQVSSDGSMGWVVVQVEGRGVQAPESGEARPIQFVSAWIELYQKRGGKWHRVGNVSNFRP